MDTSTLKPTTLRKFEDAWATVERLAKNAPHIFKSKYYAHKDASDQVGTLQFAGQELKLWREYAATRYRGMSNYAGD